MLIFEYEHVCRVINKALCSIVIHCTPLFTAISNKALNIVKSLIEKGANINATDDAFDSYHSQCLWNL